jgi:hypothetical protein
VPIQAFSEEELKPGKPGRPRKYNTSAEKSIAARARNREKKIGLLRAQAGLKTSLNGTPLHAGTIYECPTSKLPLGYVPGMAPYELIDFLREAYGYCFQHKEENSLISPAVFDPEIGPGYRQRSNIKYLCHIWLDFDEGKLSPDNFPQLFPHVQMLVCNSFNHSSQKPRFRVFAFCQSADDARGQRACLRLRCSEGYGCGLLGKQEEEVEFMSGPPSTVGLGLVKTRPDEPFLSSVASCGPETELF